MKMDNRATWRCRPPQSEIAVTTVPFVVTVRPG
jgi:hypothetical protein